LKKLAWSRKVKIIIGVTITIILMFTPMSFGARLFTNNSVTHYIYLESSDSEVSSISQKINQFDKINITLRTYNRDNFKINFDNSAFKLLSENCINLPDIQDPGYNEGAFGRSYEFDLIALENGKKEISFTDSNNLRNPDIKVSLNINKNNNILNESALANESAEKPAVGILKPLVVLVDFKDQPADYNVSTPDFYQKLLFGQGNNSLYDYYLENSMGKLKVEGSVYPHWVTVPQNYSYYENHSNGMGRYPNNSQKLVEDVLNIIGPNVNFANYDGNNDGVIDGLIIIYAGQKPNATNSYRLYPHEWAVKTQTRSGKIISSYAILPEYRYKPGDTTIGAFCHEYGHILGAKDLYDIDGLSNFQYDNEKSYGLGKWSLMSYGVYNYISQSGDSPADFDAWNKIEFGWITPITINKSINSVSIPAIETTEGKIYKFVSPTNPKEYFLIENREQIGFDTSLPGSGILIYHIDESMTSDNYAWYPGDSENDGKHYLVSLIQADNEWDLEKYTNSGDSGDPFSANTNSTYFGINSSPNNQFYNGKTSGFEIRNISDAGTVMTCDFVINGLSAPNESNTGNELVTLTNDNIIETVNPGNNTQDTGITLSISSEDTIQSTDQNNDGTVETNTDETATNSGDSTKDTSAMSNITP
jgi:M6 family metalloprotease-like protein